MAHRAVPPASGPPVVLVHGSMDRSTSFAKIARRLGDLDVCRYDRRGYGRSRRGAGAAGSGTIADHVDDLLAVIGTRPAVVIGHSLGGVIALAAAQARADAVLAVGAYEAPMPWLEWWPRSSAGTVAVARRGGDPADAAEVFMRRMIGDARWERLPSRTRTDRRSEGPALVAELRSVRAGPSFDPAAVSRVVPVQAGHGSDSAPHHVAATRELAAVTGRAAVVIEGAGHGAHASHPDEFAAFVRTVHALAAAPSLDT